MDGALTFAVALANEPTRTEQAVEQFCSELSYATGLYFRAACFWHYHRLLEAVAEGSAHFAWLPPIVAVRAADKGELVPVAVPMRSGHASYSAALFCRQGRYTQLSELSGVRAAWVDRQSAAGYLIVRAHLQRQGLALEKLFSADQFLGAHDAVARAVLEGDADVGASYVHFDPKSPADPNEATVLRAGWGRAPVHILAHAGPIPSDVISAAPSVHFSVIRVVQKTLAHAPSDALIAAARTLLSADGFEIPTQEHFASLSELLDGLVDIGEGMKHSILPPTK